MVAFCHCNLDLGRLYTDFFEVANGDEVVDLLERKMAEQDQDVLRIAKFMNSSTFKKINVHMWQSKDFISVKHKFTCHLKSTPKNLYI